MDNLAELIAALQLFSRTTDYDQFGWALTAIGGLLTAYVAIRGAWKLTKATGRATWGATKLAGRGARGVYRFVSPLPPEPEPISELAANILAVLDGHPDEVSGCFVRCGPVRWDAQGRSTGIIEVADSSATINDGWRPIGHMLTTDEFDRIQARVAEIHAADRQRQVSEISGRLTTHIATRDMVKLVNRASNGTWDNFGAAKVWTGGKEQGAA